MRLQRTRSVGERGHIETLILDMVQGEKATGYDVKKLVYLAELGRM